MNGKEIFTLGLTFVVGLFFGVYLFFSGFLDVFDQSSVQTQEELNSLSIISEVYGSCGSACPSFQVISDRSYRYVFIPRTGQDPVIRDGTLPRGHWRDIERYVTASALEEQSRPIEPAICNSYTEGIDVKYRITVNGELFIIDSCGTAIDTDTWLWVTLVNLWNYFETR